MVTSGSHERLSGDGIYGILLEMGFLASLFLCSEIVRRVLPSNAKRLNYIAWVCTLVLGWYTVSVTLVLFNKWVLGLWEKKGLNITILYTNIHMIFKGLLAAMYSYFYGIWPAMRSRKVMIVLTVAGGLAALDIVASNLSLTYISTSFYTFLKSASMVFIFVGGIVAGIEELSTALFFPIALVVLGMMFATAGETAFNLTGFSYVMASEVFAAARWIVLQVVLNAERDLTTMSCVLFMAPGSSLVLAPFAIVFEGHQCLSVFEKSGDWPLLASLMIFPGVMAFILLLVEVQLLRETSGLTMTVFGTLKTVVTILFAIAVFGDSTSSLQWGGLIIAIIGLILYSYSRGEWQFDGTFWGKPSMEDLSSERQSLVC